MGAGYQEKVANGAKNVWGTTLAFVELESEHSAATACEGFALAGGRVANFTSGQGLILMKEVLYTISGKRLPVVFNIGARALTSHSLNVHCGHDDIFGVMDVGWGCLFARTVQEAADLCLIARKTAEDTQVPFFNVQDGFFTTHTVESLCLPEAEFMKVYVGDPKLQRVPDFFDPSKALMVGVVQNQDAYMKGKIGQRLFYDRVLPALRANFDGALRGIHRTPLRASWTATAWRTPSSPSSAWAVRWRRPGWPSTTCVASLAGTWAWCISPVCGLFRPRR